MSHVCGYNLVQIFNYIIIDKQKFITVGVKWHLNHFKCNHSVQLVRGEVKATSHLAKEIHSKTHPDSEDLRIQQISDSPPTSEIRLPSQLLRPTSPPDRVSST